MCTRKVEQLERRRRKRGGKGLSRDDEAILATERQRAKKLGHVKGLFEQALARVEALEDSLMLATLNMEEITEGEVTARGEEFQHQWREALLAYARRDMRTPDRARLWIHSPHNEAMFLLAREYLRWADSEQLEATLTWASPFSSADNDSPEPEGAHYLTHVRDAHKFLAEPSEVPGGILLRLKGKDALLKLIGEQGVHTLHDGRDYFATPVDVRVFESKPELPEVPYTPDGRLRRNYDISTRLTFDHLLGKNHAMAGGRIESVLARCIRDSMAHGLHARFFA
jgi:hypothetical protein